MNKFIKNTRQASNLQFSIGIIFIILLTINYKFIYSEIKNTLNPIPFYIFTAIFTFIGTYFIIQGIHTRYFFEKKINKYLSKKKTLVKNIVLKYNDFSDNSNFKKYIGMQKICVNVKISNKKNLYFLFNPSDFFDVINYLYENFERRIINIDKNVYQFNFDTRNTKHLCITLQSV